MDVSVISQQRVCVNSNVPTQVPHLRLEVVLICSSLRLCVDFKQFHVLAFRNKYLGIWEIIRVSYNYDQGIES